MAKSTGPILAVGAITLANQVIFHDQPINWRIPIATGIAAMGLALVEPAMGKAAPMLAWAALFTVVFVRVTPGVPSPVETLNSWWHEK